MCGIAGWIDWERDLRQQHEMLERMVCTLEPRGPDAGGTWLSQHAALAHRRLIVIDPAGGKQPMHYAVHGHKYVITYNGEIYNFRELRSELETLGHTFKTHSDTEVILHAYDEWGTDFLDRLNGIFAIALWDEPKRTLLLARDPLGVKPLFYAQRGSALLFGSELKALLANPLVKPEVDSEGLNELFGLVNTPGQTVFRDVKQLRAGYAMLHSPEQTRIWQFWKLQSAPHTDDVDTTVERLRSLLQDTVKRQLIADVPVVSLLSGGLDSSGITGLAQRFFKQEGKTLHSYSIDFVESAQHFHGSLIRPSLDTPFIQQMVDYLGTEHHNIVVDNEALLENALVPMYAHDRPGMGQMSTSLYLLFKAIKSQATVALSGESADEVFGGYPWFHHEEAIKADTFPWMALRGRQANLGQISLFSPALEARLKLSEYRKQRYEEALAEVPRLPGEDAENARMREIFYLNLTHFLPLLLDRKDRMSMAAGVEVRVPFCDKRIVEYVWNIPWKMKTIDGQEKGILRRALADVLPEEVRKRKKSAYPSTFHPGYVQGIQQRLSQVLDNPEAPLLSLVNVPLVRRLVEMPAENFQSDMGPAFLEYLLQTNAWLDSYHVTIV
ncbi:asparagine synthase (glutamine-hydrolysing) [Thermosporothrix hazakensis]|jgi:asparagine synthase (glutamine-hydrolysing)|uniref:asparagine synthase (glutamine-hydrolyzing) n=1 Tax=Thermosporothrix hazakensis TaxID=644383 RepID=A0A326UMT7_THEHA|nr:asparagine synthase (glutamine-hydrolyzing) [Thermosporothrix hazakensis]PZW31195.1 asparagine synthase (glutamine-hydrolysing) [Thermosporothrix hazakensis]GCE50894.1 asparagine synthetase B [Thermosporothrix hazakensis]